MQITRWGHFFHPLYRFRCKIRSCFLALQGQVLSSVSLRYTRAHDKLCSSLPATLYLRLQGSFPTVLRYTSRSQEAPDTVFWRQVTAESQSAKECVFVLKLLYTLIQLGPVVRRPISANPGLNFNLGLFFFCSKAFSRIIFSILFRVSNHQIVDKKN